MVTVPDPRLQVLSDMSGSDKIIPTLIEFVDIAGLVKGASEGAGLGHQFLAHIREVDAIVQVVRCFDNDDIIHELGSVDPLRDIDTVSYTHLDVYKRQEPGPFTRTSTSRKPWPMAWRQASWHTTCPA